MSALTQDSRRRVLRVGLVRDGRIIEERTLRANESLRAGSSEKNELILRSPHFGASYTLVKAAKGGYVLHVPAKAVGRISEGEDPQELSGSETLMLTERSRGRLQIGDATILFQFVPEPVSAQSAQLPIAARGGLGRGIDWLFTAFVLASYTAFFGLVIYLENADWELESPNLLPEITARLVFQEPPPPVEAPQLTPAPVEEVQEVVASTEDSSRESPRNSRSRDSNSRESASPGPSNEDPRIREAAIENARNMLDRKSVV